MQCDWVIKDEQYATQLLFVCLIVNRLCSLLGHNCCEGWAVRVGNKGIAKCNAVAVS